MIKRKINWLLIVFLSINCGLFSQSKNDYNNRQLEFTKHMTNGVALIYASTRMGKLNKNFYYLTGKTDLTMALMLSSEGEDRSLFFTNGDKSLRNKLSKSISKADELWVSFDDLDKIKDLRFLYATKQSLKNTDYLFYKLREIKDDVEQKLISNAVEITAASYNHMLKTLKPGLIEQDVIDAFKQKQLDLGAQSTSFIQAGSGINGTQIHAEPTNKIIEKGDLVVFDVGAWYKNYTSDISRTFPANGKFTKAQKQIYQLVLDAQKAGIKKMVPGEIMLEVQKTVENVLVDGLFDLGLITDKNSDWQRKFYIVHGYYHYIGLDIHDCYSFMSRETATKAYEPGMIMTMEPGLYFPPTFLDKKPKKAQDLTDEEFATFVKQTRKTFERYANMGVRIEDDILITEEGNLVLSRKVPKEIKDIEEMMKD